jgi:hypothetical protein
MRKSMVLAGSLAQKPGQGGHTWVFLQYLLGFKRLGWEVLFLDRLEPEMCRAADGQPCALEQSENLRYLRQVMGCFGLSDAFALAYDRGQHWVGLSRMEARKRVRSAVFLLNVMGYFDDQEILDVACKRVFLDIDPGFGQMWQDAGLARVFHGDDQYVTIGENIGRPDCTIPTCGLSWITTPQPVVLDFWAPIPPAALEGAAFTSIGAWRGPYAPIEYQGHTYGLRVHEFRRFVTLPKLTAQRFEAALDIHPTETRDLELLRTNGWSLVAPRLAAANPWKYQDYLCRSRAEFMVAKNLYVQSNSGWFSDRSICYLATGRPVLAQDTGIRDLYPTGAGLLTFTTLEEAAAGVDAINRDYARHCQAARKIAVEYFDSDVVLARLLDRLGVG